MLELGTQGASCQPFISQKRKLQPETPHPAGPLRPPRLSSDHTPPQERELLYPRAFWTCSWHPPCLHLTWCLLSSSIALSSDLTLASSQPWPGIH